MRFLFAINVVVAVLAFGSYAVQAGDAGVVRVGHYTAEVGEEVTVVLQAVAIPPPGLGAWAVDVIYDSALVHATACTSEQGGVCSPAFSDDTVRVTGAVVTEGLTGNFPLATFTFTCDAAGTSELEVVEVLFTTAEPQLEIDDLLLDHGSITCEEPGQDGLIRIGSHEAVVGGDVTVTLEAVDIPVRSALGAWVVDVTYDTSVVSLLECDARQGGICIPEFGDDTLRVTGASAAGLPGTTTLADIVFGCSRAGTTDLAVFVSVGGSAVFQPGDPLPPGVMSGSLVCTEAQEQATGLPTTGAWSQPGSAPATVLLAVLGAVLLGAAIAVRRYASPR